MRAVTTCALRSPLHLLAIVAVLLALSVAAVGCETSAEAATQDTSDAVGTATAAQTAPAQTDGTSTTAETVSAMPRVASGTGLFDSSTVHDIAISFAQEDYDAMIQAYQETGDKEWIEATVTIDGKTFENVGVRLKGNSSIMGLRNAGMGGRTGRTGAESTGGDQATGDESTAYVKAAAAPADGQQGFAGPMGGDASTDSPETLPWLVDLDRNVENQNYEGVIEFAVRSNTSETALNEAVALDLLQAAGLASQEAVYASFSVNGSEPCLRLIIENPDDLWMAANFSITGALYKAESTGDYSYRGDEADSYAEVFDQEAGKTNADLTPLIEFLEFINNADDATFNAELPDRLDIDAFATYLAMEELLNNFDDIDGPGNNSYLYYDTKTGKFTVVAWDHNLAFGAMGAMGGLGGAGGFGGGTAGAGGFPGVDGQTFDGTLPKGMEPPDGKTPSGGMQFPGGTQDDTGAQRPGGAQGQPGAGGGFGGKSNILVQRFKANPEWVQLYEDQLAELKVALYESGTAAEILAGWVDLLKTQASDLVDAATVDQEAANISTQFTAQ
jgi:spore coat protein CotH